MNPPRALPQAGVFRLAAGEVTPGRVEVRLDGRWYPVTHSESLEAGMVRLHLGRPGSRDFPVGAPIAVREAL